MEMRDDLLFDKRVTERHIKKGLLDRETLNKHLEALEDKKAECVPIKAEKVHQKVHN